MLKLISSGCNVCAIPAKAQTHKNLFLANISGYTVLVSCPDPTHTMGGVWARDCTTDIPVERAISRSRVRVVYRCNLSPGYFILGIVYSIRTDSLSLVWSIRYRDIVSLMCPSRSPSPTPSPSPIPSPYPRKFYPWG